MDLRLNGKRAIVTGGTRGIGRAVAESLAAEGVSVAVCARNQSQVDETVEALRKNRVDAIGGRVDIADGPALKAWITATGEALGGIDILVSCPGALVRQNSESDWQRNFAIDVLGAVRSFEAARPFLERAARQKGDAALVIIASAAAAEADEESSYGPMKAALVHFAKGIARQQASRHIRANVVSPGTIYVKDGYWGKVERDEPDRFMTFLKRNPTGRMGSPQDVANAVLFLASPVSSFTTGINLIIDGAYTARVNF